jgi:hypothetical protein
MFYLRNWQKWISVLVGASLIFSLAGLRAVQARANPDVLIQETLQPQVRYASKHDTSPSLRDIVSLMSAEEERMDEGYIEPRPRLSFPKVEEAAIERAPAVDPILQNASTGPNMPGTDFNFEGIDNRNGVLPPDTNGDVGPNHYLQWVNLSLAVWQLDRDNNTATMVFGPINGNAIWNGFGGACESTNDGDPIVLYDHLADRWFISQFGLPNFPSGPYYQCIAVSQSGDPTGAWHRYAFVVSNTKMNDYPHFGVWPDGYYMTINQFTGGASWGGAGVAVYERDKMLLGQSARQVYIDLDSVNSNFGGMLPSDLDGPPPPAGTPNYFAEVDDSSWIGPEDAMRIWEFHVDWTITNNSTFGISGNPNAILTVANFNPLYSDIPQPDTYQGLDNLADRLMHRLQYRYFGTHETLVTNHTVNAGGGHAGVRWYEVRKATGSWNIHQQGTYAGDGSNSEHRWMGSAAMDSAGNLAIGYSLSSGAVYPSIAYAGRLVNDPLDTMPQGEAMLIAGGGSQTHYAGRWGDYSMLSVDPTDNCTFWFTSEYLSATGSAPWQTRVGSFTFPSCLTGLTGTLEGHVTNSSLPIPNAIVETNGFSTTTGGDGFYQFPDLPAGTYTVTVSAYGYQPETVSNIDVLYNVTTTQDFNLTPAPMVNLSGVVSDGSGQGWPLYARIDISAPGGAQTIFSDPITGAYSVEIAQGISHSFEVNAVSSGYLTENALLTPTAGVNTRDFLLSIDLGACNATGYGYTGTCTALPGGLVLGNVYDDNTGMGINNATVTSDEVPGEVASTFATPEDPAVDDGFYVLFSSLIGTHSFTAAGLDYEDYTQDIDVASGDIAGVNFNLPAGMLEFSPVSLSENLSAYEMVTRVITLTNTGSYTATFNLSEVNAPARELIPTGPFAIPTRHTSPKHLADLDASAVYEYNPPETNQLAGGNVLRSWNSELDHLWGIGYDTFAEDVWIGNVTVGGGDDRLYRFLPGGSSTGETIDAASLGAYFGADMTYNLFTHNFWQMNVSGGNCLVEIDPIQKSLTGREICPSFDNSQRGLAYNPLDGTFFSGTWTNGILYHFTETGTILDSVDVNLSISGLAFNPATRHLFVLTNADKGFDVYVLDTEANYAVTGGFDIPGLGDFAGAGMSIDCDGHLWVANQITQQVFEIESGETTPCSFADIPWLTVSPGNGSLLPGEEEALLVTINASAALAGSSQGNIIITTDTPYGSSNIPVNIDVQAVYNVSVDPTTDAIAARAGSTVVYTLNITNIGNATDLYNISTIGNLWETSRPSQVGPLLAGANINFDIAVTIPADASEGDSDTVSVLITSYSNPDVSTAATLTTTARLTHHLYMPSLSR